MKILFACGTDDGKTFTDEHFGSASFYMIYSMDKDSGKIEFVKRMENTSPQERDHGDPERARYISQMFSDVPVLVAFAMGPNITRMRKRFVPVISRVREIESALEILPHYREDIIKEMEKPEGEDRRIIYLK
ncbi:MAG: NifB/NifX family molybdenum-iron cluster-binding protein [Thermoplasmata archaeon]|nr:NifB/NifX family molybdenum-iron cluster-binding protein [Thermoplasmata archaeon]